MALAVAVASGVEVTGVLEIRGVGVAVAGNGVAVWVASGVPVTRGVEVTVGVEVGVGVSVVDGRSDTVMVRVDLVPRPNSSRYSTVMVRVPVPDN